MSRPISTYDMDDSLNLNDREDFLLFLRYPEIDIDSVDDASSPHSSVTLTAENRDEFKSSPPFVTATSGYRSKSPATESTAHGTPNSLLLKEEKTKSGGWNEFIHLMQRSDLPQECLQYLTSLGQAILKIGTILHSTLRPNQPSSVLRIGRWLLNSIKSSSKQAANQLEAVSYLKSLVAFNIKPGELEIWSAFQQRAQLIAEYDNTILQRSKANDNERHVLLPSKREADLLESLVVLFDAYVYHSFLQLYDVDCYGKPTFNMINDIYDNLMKWLQNYKKWCQGMIELRSQYIQPLVEQLSQSESTREDLAEFRLRIAKAKAALTRPVATNVSLMTEELVKHLNLSARRPVPETSVKRSKTRYEREHTL